MSDRLYRYEPGQDMDMALLYWHDHLSKTGDLERLVLPDARTPSGFLLLFDRCDLFFSADSEGVRGAFWVEPFLSSAFFSMYLREDFRQKEGVAWAKQAYAMVLDKWPMIWGFTGQKRLLPIHRKMGYTIVTSIPGAWDGEDGWVMYLTRDAWLARHRSPQKWWSKEHG